MYIRIGDRQRSVGTTAQMAEEPAVTPEPGQVMIFQDGAGQCSQTVQCQDICRPDPRLKESIWPALAPSSLENLFFLLLMSLIVGG